MQLVPPRGLPSPVIQNPPTADAHDMVQGMLVHMTHMVDWVTKGPLVQRCGEEVDEFLNRFLWHKSFKKYSEYWLHAVLTKLGD